MSARHVQLLHWLLDEDESTILRLADRCLHLYKLKNPYSAMERDAVYLLHLGAIKVYQRGEATIIRPNLDWPTQITETEFFKKVKTKPKGKVHGFLSR